MEEETLYNRIGEADLNPTYKDGQVYQHTDVNNMLSILKTAVNENYYDIQKLENGTKDVEKAKTLDGATLSRYLDETLQADDNKVPSSQQAKAYMDNLFAEYSPPIRGVDYWTEEDKQEIIDEAASDAQLEPKGEYDPTVQYSKLDIVFYENSSYVALQTTQGNLPTDTDYWQILVSGELSVDDIVDNLESNYSNKVLSAKQGKVLNEGKIQAFNTVADMKLANLKAGMTAKILGYYEVNDGGAGLFIIRNKSLSDTVDNASIIELSDNTLVAELIIFNESINIKQFGAIEDGTTDDLTYFQKAINYISNNTNIKNLVLNNKEYYISDTITITSTNIIGNNATIKFNQSESSDSYPLYITGNDFIIENLNVSLNPNSFYGWAFRMRNCYNVKINNGNFTHAIDLYSKNSNIEINNIVSNTGITVRELFNEITENITFTNCIVDRPAMPDEVVWIVSSYGTIRNIKIVNCDIRHRGVSENYIAISGYRENSICENVIFENCKFDFTVSGFRAMHFNFSSQQIKGITRNVFFNNCQFDISGTSSTDNIYLCQNESETDMINFNNCKFNIPNAFKYGFVNSNINNSNIEMKATDYCFNTCKINNCNITASNCTYLTVGGNEIINSKITHTGLVNLINNNLYGTLNKTLIRNCEINVTSETLFQININTGHFTVEDSKINNISNGTVFKAFNTTDTCYITLKNVDLSSEYSHLASSNNNILINVYNLIHNNSPIAVNINDIDANTRKAMNINTIILAPISIGLYYRKVSTGNLTSNWQLYGGQ